MDNLPDIVALVFEFIRPNLDSSRTKAKNGKKGGGASKTKATERKRHDRQKRANEKAKKVSKSKKQIANTTITGHPR